MKNHTLSNHELQNSAKVLEMVSNTKVEIWGDVDVDTDFLEFRINGHFMCAVKYEMSLDIVVSSEYSSFNGLNDSHSSITTTETEIIVHVDCNSFKHLKGHSVPYHKDIICQAIENKLLTYFKNQESC